MLVSATSSIILCIYNFVFEYFWYIRGYQRLGTCCRAGWLFSVGFVCVVWGSFGMLDSCFLNRIHVRYPFLGLSKFLGDRLVFRRKRLLHEAMKYICVGGHFDDEHALRKGNFEIGGSRHISWWTVERAWLVCKVEEYVTGQTYSYRWEHNCSLHCYCIAFLVARCTTN